MGLLFRSSSILVKRTLNVSHPGGGARTFYIGGCRGVEAFGMGAKKNSRVKGHYK